MQLTKSDYTTFLKHPTWLWLKKHQKDALPPADPALQALFDAGNEFERYAEQLFPDAINLGFENYDDYQTLPTRTKAALDDGAQTIFQGRFEFNDLTCIVDVLQRATGDSFDLFEIKASTRAKSEHIPDLAFQKIVLEGAGIKIRNLGVIHVNNQYVRHGEIDIRSLTTKTDVTEKVGERLVQTKQEIDQALKIMDRDTMPDPSPRFADSLSDWMEIYEGLKGPFQKGSIYNLASLKPEQVAELEDADVSQIKDIPLDMELTRNQTRQVAVTKSAKRHTELEKIAEFLQQLQYPLYFLDYETFSDVIPVFDGQRPYQATPFQYSLHILRDPKAKLEHVEYLHSERSNPVPQLVKRLSADIGSQGSIIVWYAPFEKGRNDDMAEMSPDHAAFLEDINSRTIDLMVPFKSGWFSDKDFLGSASIKKVLPVLVPDLSYDGLEIASGDVAQRKWMDTIIRSKEHDNAETVMTELRNYCELDTLAMVRIFEVLRDLVDFDVALAEDTTPNFFSRIFRSFSGDKQAG